IAVSSLEASEAGQLGMRDTAVFLVPPWRDRSAYHWLDGTLRSRSSARRGWHFAWRVLSGTLAISLLDHFPDRGRLGPEDRVPSLSVEQRKRKPRFGAGCL